jgi:hypothetical protein
MNDQVDAVPAAQSPSNGKLSAAANQIPIGLNEWITMLGNPDPLVFKPDPAFEWGRLLRMVIVVLSFSGVMLGTALVVYRGGSLYDIVFQKAPTAVLLAGALLAVGYTFVASLFGVRVGLRDAFFTILLLGLPWLSLTAALYVWAGASKATWMGLVLVIWILLAPFMLIRNICRGLGMIVPDCNKWRIRCSVVIPVLLLAVALFLVHLFAEVPAATP